ncbi:uncharacterized protein LOC130053333 [Ostrea edulis]|uniref:uncharacterized protein LOC130053333 n=1 Tax=Ostrea edulis TaxID=37623 RepID=UPI0024AE8E3C|nr:uncharacterized protein LOC130053333 [Ostrea edulis]
MKYIVIVFVIGSICGNTTGYLFNHSASRPPRDEYQNTIQKSEMACLLSKFLTFLGRECRNGTVNATIEIKRADISENAVMGSANVTKVSDDDYNPVICVVIPISLIGIAIIIPIVFCYFTTCNSHPPLTAESSGCFITCQK